MVWILVLAAALAGCLFAAHRLVWSTEPFGPVRGRLLPVILAYASAVVVAGHLTAAAINIHQVTRRELTLTSADKAEGIVQVLSTQLADAAWQAGLVLAASFLLALALRRAAPDVA